MSEITTKIEKRKRAMSAVASGNASEAERVGEDRYHREEQGRFQQCHHVAPLNPLTAAIGQLKER
jgi:hypothetical protein